LTKPHVIDFERPIVEMEARLDDLKKHPAAHQPDIEKEIAFLEEQIYQLKQRVYKNLTPWQRVQLARHPNRPRTSSYITAIFQDFTELHGDRCFEDDPAVIGGLARIGRFNVMVVGQEKGADTRDRIKRNFGMAHPEGFRKAARLFKLAGKFGLPLVTLIDTPGAYAGIEAEERGQALAISDCLRILSHLPTPTVAINIGEGGSGGALAFGVTDRVLMLENAYYSVITPEGCAAILWQDKEKAAEAAKALTLTAQDLHDRNLIDGIIEEPLGGAHRDQKATAKKVAAGVNHALEQLSELSVDQTLEKRYDRWRTMA
jgi:acetyl-CoA carboxylase carboxyl transferase subunit alpha